MCKHIIIEFRHLLTTRCVCTIIKVIHVIRDRWPISYRFEGGLSRNIIKKSAIWNIIRTWIFFRHPSLHNLHFEFHKLLLYCYPCPLCFHNFVFGLFYIWHQTGFCFALIIFHCFNAYVLMILSFMVMNRGKVASKREEIDNCMDKRISLYPSLIIRVYIL